MIELADLHSMIKKVIEHYLKNKVLCDLVYGTYTGGGLKIDSKPVVIPLDMMDIPQRLKEGEQALKSGDKVAVIQKQG